MPEVQTTETPEPQSQEYIDEMVAKAEAEETKGEEPTLEPPEPQRPEWLPAKFNTAEDMAKAYSELESKMGSQNQETQSDPPETPVENTTEEQAKGMLSEQGLDYAKFEKEFTDSGELSQNSYQELADSGLSREFVDSYIKGQQSLAEQNRQNAYTEAGGEEQFQQMIKWAGDNLSQGEIDAYNNSLSGDAEKNKFAIRSMVALWKQETGFAPNLVQGRPNTAANGFNSWAQVSEAMRDPRYRNDPAYRQNIEQRMALSELDS